MKTYKKHIVIGLVVLGVVVSGLTANALVHSNCNYDSSSGNYVVNNKTYAYGTMSSAFQCALYGVLPQVVIDRLGMFGDEETKEEAKEIIKTNEDNQKKE